VKDEEPADYAKRVVESEGYDLVVLGARGQHSKMQEVFLGSVCEKIMNSVTCDTLVIK
jgi:nucleotide-binding universal stress UspA family protein